jgi:hypothetical protein
MGTQKMPKISRANFQTYALERRHNKQARELFRGVPVEDFPEAEREFNDFFVFWSRRIHHGFSYKNVHYSEWQVLPWNIYFFMLWMRP